MRQKPAIAHARVRLLGAALTGLAAAGGVVEVHTYDQMWHVFTMYYEGCEHPRLQKLLFAYSSLNLTSAFLRQLASTKDHGQLPWKSNGIPYTLTHYEYPRGVDAAMEWAVGASVGVVEKQTFGCRSPERHCARGLRSSSVFSWIG